MHGGLTPLRCKHMTTGMHGSCTTVELHRYGADIRPHACMEAAPLRRYTAMVQTYDHRHARRLRHCGVMPLWCRHRAVVLHVHHYEGKSWSSSSSTDCVHNVMAIIQCLISIYQHCFFKTAVNIWFNTVVCNSGSKS